jgi:hypothetical protein
MDRRKDARKGCASFRSWRPIRGRVSRWSSQWEGVRHINCEPCMHAHIRFQYTHFITAMRQGKQTFANGNSYDGQFLQVFAGVCLFVCIVSTFVVSGIVYTFNHTRAHTRTRTHTPTHIPGTNPRSWYIHMLRRPRVYWRVPKQQKTRTRAVCRCCHCEILYTFQPRH